MDAVLNKEGLLIPKKLLKGFERVEIIRRGYEVVIKPKSVTKQVYGMIKPRMDVERLIEEMDLGAMWEEQREAQ